MELEAKVRFPKRSRITFIEPIQAPVVDLDNTAASPMSAPPKPLQPTLLRRARIGRTS